MSLIKSKSRYLLSVLLLAAVILSATGHIPKLIDSLGLHKLKESNETYLQSSFDRSLATFGILSGIKVGLAVIEGTEVGVGFGLEIGDAVQAAYDYIDLAWRTVLAATTILLGTRFILQSAELVGRWFLIITFSLLFIQILISNNKPKVRKAKQIFRDLGFFMTILTLAVLIILPLSITGGRLLSERITAPSINEARTGFSQVRADLFPEGQKQSGGIFSQLSGTKDRVEKLAEYLGGKAKELVVWVLKIIAGYIFDTIIFPLVLFVLLFWLTKLIAKYLFDMRRNQSFKDDLENIFARYFEKSRPAA